ACPTRTEDEGREGFDRYNNEVDEGRQARNDQRGLHVLTEPVTLHTRVDKHHICHKRQYQREADTSAWGDVQERDEGRQVRSHNSEEDCRNHRQEPATFLLA